MLYADFLLTSSESAVRQEIETLNTSSLLNCDINQKRVGNYSEKRGMPAKASLLQQTTSCTGLQIQRISEGSAYREEGLNDVRLDGAEGLVFDDDEDLLLFFQVYEVTEPRLLGKSV